MNCPTCGKPEDENGCITDFDGLGDPLYWCSRCGTMFDSEDQDVPSIIHTLTKLFACLKSSKVEGLRVVGGKDDAT